MEAESLWISVASSSAVAVLGAALGWIYQKFAVPLAQATFRKTPNISGTWYIIATDEPGKGSKVGHVEITQVGTRIKAVYHRRKRSDGTVRKFKCTGRFTSGQLVLTSEEVSKEGYNVGSIVLKLSSDGRILEGLNVYRSHDTGAVISVPARLTQG